MYEDDDDDVIFVAVDLNYYKNLVRFDVEDGCSSHVNVVYVYQSKFSCCCCCCY